MEMQDVLTTVNGNPITVRDVVTHIKFNGTFRNAIYKLIEVHVIANRCEALGVTVDEKEFREFADTKRRLLGLFSAEAMNQYCKWHGIVMDQWNHMVRQELLRTKLIKEIITEGDIDRYFEEHKSDFLMAVLSRIVCTQRQEIDQAKQRILNHGEDFATVAREISIEKNTRIAGGYLGSIRYGSLPAAINEAIFKAEPGCILGPYDQGGYWVLYRVAEINNAHLDDLLKKNIAEQLFAKWLQNEVLTARA